jgi:hypothetical protein
VKRITLAKASYIVTGAVILAIFLVPPSLAMKNSNTPFTGDICDDKASFFPSSLTTRLNRNHQGSVSGFEIHLSNTDGKCSVLVFASNAAESEIDLNSSHNRHDDFIASN